jgi:hypothetical protein
MHVYKVEIHTMYFIFAYFYFNVHKKLPTYILYRNILNIGHYYIHTYSFGTAQNGQRFLRKLLPRNLHTYKVNFLPNLFHTQSNKIAISHFRLSNRGCHCCSGNSWAEKGGPTVDNKAKGRVFHFNLNTRWISLTLAAGAESLHNGENWRWAT